MTLRTSAILLVLLVISEASIRWLPKGILLHSRFHLLVSLLIIDPCGFQTHVQSTRPEHAHAFQHTSAVVQPSRALLTATGAYKMYLPFPSCSGVDRVPEERRREKGYFCSKAYGLTGRQVKFCRENFDWMQALWHSAQETKEECQRQMQLRQWNCASINRAPNLSDDLNADTREAGFVHALSIAALALAVGRGCMAGNLRGCFCKEENRQLSLPTDEINAANISVIDEKLGCKKILNVGKQFALEFLTSGLKGKPLALGQQQEVAIKRHNIKAGLKAVDDASTIECVCNGATASCAVKICYRRVAHLAEIAGHLVGTYDRAVKSKLVTIDGQLEPFEDNLQVSNAPVTLESIVYSDETPNPCDAPGFASDPLFRRPCVPNGTDSNSCEKLCCGRGYLQRTIEVATQCNCKFQFCCKVECDTCLGKRTIYECQ